MSQRDLFQGSTPKQQVSNNRGPERTILTISSLNHHAKALLESMGLLWVTGEVSNLSRPTSGHLYFTLKDDRAQIRCAWFRGAQRGLTARRLADGDHILVRARTGLYAARGDYQLIIEYAETAGEGALKQAFEDLKEKLETEGLFDLFRKKPLPTIPRTVGLITSATGSVLHDLRTTFARRFPAIRLILYPVPVQGADAALHIANMIRLANTRAETEALILARGGGSLEDLAAFNSESVARAIHASMLPIVTGIGHETDITIADWVADRRAPTPTAAAEILSADSASLTATYAASSLRLARLMANKLNNARQNVDLMAAKLTHPRARLDALGSRFSVLGQRLAQAGRHHAQKNAMRLNNAIVHLQQRALPDRLAYARRTLNQAEQRLKRCITDSITHAHERHSLACARINALSPLATLGRGYAIIEKMNGHIVRDARTIWDGEKLTARLQHGTLKLIADKKDA